MTLTVLSVAPPLALVGPEPSGTADQVLTGIDAALLRAGHRSVVIAREGSSVAGVLVPMQTNGDAPAARMRATIMEAIDRHEVDLVHLHGPDFMNYLPPPGVPVLVTLHRPLDRYPADALAPARPDTFLQGVSVAQTAAAPPGAILLPPIEPGVPVDRLFIRVPKRRFVAAIGRVAPERGFHLALEAARRADMQFVLAGDVPRTPEAARYYREEIHPRLDGRRRYLGPIGFARKRWMLGAARCLLAPSLSGEAASLSAIEALACGTPVVAFPTGALAEIVEPGVTGFLVGDVEEMAEAIDRAEGIDPEACRAAARARYSQDAMAARYLALYDDLIVGNARAEEAVAGAA
ncbi:glycosyltransferase [Azospirillum sp. SYSU D00513]|uniref:glycosyltransferase n=1 Tax=Azospirillum sp. SYSU D00513 TaxID=2812561 RepID=UPI001A96559B|nr:glycosyltransferase [Azospirillum sp. SYSU D00513]